MSERRITLSINGETVQVSEGQTVAAVLLDAQRFAFRASATGESRGPLCGMGVCYECRVTIDDVAHRRACMTVVRAGMRVRTTGDRA